MHVVFSSIQSPVIPSRNIYLFEVSKTKMDRHNCPSPYQQKSNYERKLQLERDIVRAKASFDNLKEDLAKARIEKEYLLKSIYSTEVRNGTMMMV